MRLIDADVLIEKIKTDKFTHVRNEYQSGYNDGLFHAEVVADNMPTVDAVPVRHGKWKLIRMEDNGDGFYTCSNCDRGDIHSPLVSVPYCWYCGARMDEERKE